MNIVLPHVLPSTHTSLEPFHQCLDVLLVYIARVSRRSVREIAVSCHLPRTAKPNRAPYMQTFACSLQIRSSVTGRSIFPNSWCYCSLAGLVLYC